MKPTPETVYQELKAKGGRPVKLRNLDALHELCRNQYDSGSRAFSVADIGKLCEQRKIMNARGLFNAMAADYRSLIKAWGDYAGPAPGRPKSELQGEEFLHRISDPAIRMLVQKAILKARKLESQINTLRSLSKMVVDKRPPLPSAEFAQVNPAGALTHAEKDALATAISAEFLEEQGWKEGPHGAILNANGRTIFSVGFASGIRKALAHRPSAPPTI